MNIKYTYTMDYPINEWNTGFSHLEVNRLKTQLEWWESRGDNAFKYLAKAHNDIKDLNARIELERKELLAYKMFYLATKLATQVSSDDNNAFTRSVERILEAEAKIDQILNNRAASE